MGAWRRPLASLLVVGGLIGSIAVKDNDDVYGQPCGEGKVFTKAGCVALNDKSAKRFIVAALSLALWGGAFGGFIAANRSSSIATPRCYNNFPGVPLLTDCDDPRICMVDDRYGDLAACEEAAANPHHGLMMWGTERVCRAMMADQGVCGVVSHSAADNGIVLPTNNKSNKNDRRGGSASSHHRSHSHLYGESPSLSDLYS